MPARSEAFLPPPPPSAVGPRFNEVQQTSAHNAYALQASISEQLSAHGVRSLEIDVHTTRWAQPRLAGDWYVYHADVPGMRDTSCARFSECLKSIRAFHERSPDHEVLTLFVDLKDRFDGEHSAADLDRVLVAELGRDALITPSDLLLRCSANTLRESVSGACGWPRLVEMRGKILIGITGGSICRESELLHTYAANDREAASRVAFLAPDVSSSCPYVPGRAARSHVVLFNMTLANVADATQIKRDGLVARLYRGGFSAGLDDDASWRTAVLSDAQILATDRIDSKSRAL